MKSFWTLCLVAVMAAMGFSSYGQAREVVKNISITQRSGKLIKATGWVKNSESGRWVSHPNAIDERAIYDWPDDGFTWIQTGSFTYQGAKYYVLFYSMPGGGYKYPSISQGLYHYNEMEYCLMTVDQYAKFVRSLNNFDGTITQVNYQKGSGKGIGWGSTEADMYVSITDDLAKSGGKLDMKDTMDISAQVVNGTKVVRFLISTILLIDIEDLHKYISPIAKRYFETDPASFRTLFMPLTAEENANVEKIVKAGNEQREADEAKIRAEAAVNAEEHKDKIAALNGYNTRRIADSISKLEKLNAISRTWRTSDTLVSSYCNWQSGTGGKQDFLWSAFCSLEWEGKKLYVVCYKMGRRSDSKDCSFLVLNADQYIHLKNAFGAQAGTDVSETSKVQGASYTSYDVQRMLKDILSDATYSTPESCIEINVKKDKVMFRWPDASCPSKGLSSQGGTGYWECDTKEFAKLFTLP